MMPKVELIDVTLEFSVKGRSQSKTMALESINLHIDPHEIVALVGPSGCGKSTILNIIAGFLRPNSGQVLMDGKPVNSIALERLVVFQAPALFPWLEVLDNVTFGPRMRGIPSAEYLPVAKKIIEDVGLSAFPHHFPYQLSGGMRQRVQIARALINRPEVLLLDEPFGALDAQTRLEMQEMLLQIWEQYQATILFITHDVEEALFLADRTYVLCARPGRVKCEIAVPFNRPRERSLLGDEHFARLKSDLLSSLSSLADRSGGVIDG
jgi:NitT/TauT family transport system ATP-binding protein